MSAAHSQTGPRAAEGAADRPGGKPQMAVAKPLGQLSVNGPAFAPDGKTIAGGGDAGKLTLFDAKTGAEVEMFSGARAILNEVAFAPDGRRWRPAGRQRSLPLHVERAFRENPARTRGAARIPPPATTRPSATSSVASSRCGSRSTYNGGSTSVASTSSGRI